MKNKKYGGFTLLEMLVVVLIIGILAGIALPQYQMAVTKAKVASILPIMRRWKDALQEWKLQHGYYCTSSECDESPYGEELGVNWPSGWECITSKDCWNNYWYCTVNEEIGAGYVYCNHKFDSDNEFFVAMYQSDDPFYEDVRGMITCEGRGNQGNKVCKSLGGKIIENVEAYCYPSPCDIYKLN